MLENAITYEHPIDIIEPEDETQDEALDVSEVGSVPVGALLVFLRLVMPNRDRMNPALTWKTVCARVAALGRALHFEGIGDKSIQALADEIGCTRSLISLNETKLRDFGKLDNLDGKTLTARIKYSERARSVWNQRKALTPPTPSPGHGGTDDEQTRHSGQRRAKDRAMGGTTPPGKESLFRGF